MDDSLYSHRANAPSCLNLWRTGGATVAEFKDALDEPLAYTSAPSALQTLEDKAYLTRTLLLELIDHCTGFGMARPPFSARFPISDGD